MSDGALERAQLVRSLAEALSTEAPVANIWSHYASLLAALAGSECVTIALREPAGDRIACRFDAGRLEPETDDAVPAGSLAAEVLATGTTIRRDRASRRSVGVPVHFGRKLFGAICFEGIAAYDPEHVALLESCALSLGTRLYHEASVQSSERYAELALIDGLTGIPNRRSFDETFAREWGRAVREGTQLAMLMIDLDYFKSFNDGYGHQAGDLCLQRVARTLHDRIRRPTDFVARYGGEEFVVLLPGTDLGGAIALAEELRTSVAELNIPHEGSSLGRITLSMGAAAGVPTSPAGAEALLQVADDALYYAKLGGRNRVCAQGYESATHAARPQRTASRNNLPLKLTRMIGRRNEIQQAQALLASHRLVSIVGSGGTGKTRVAIAVASEMADRFDDGLWFVDLSALVDPSLIGATIAAALGTPIPTGEAATEALAGLLGAQRVLLVLDNCEHLVTDVAKLSDTLLHICGGLSILTTSREPLGISGEVVYRLPLLSMPSPNAEPRAAEAIVYDAIALFVERAIESRHGFELDDRNIATVLQICRDTDGIALAIELAASRVGTIGLPTLAQRLHDFRLLGGSDRSAVPRQQTMHAMIAWSYDLLSEAECTLFRRLAIFAGGFTFDAATAICASDPIARDDVFDLITSLMHKSLVTDEAAGAGRYRLLEPLRAFARERLLDAGEMQRVARRHAEFFEAFARRADATFRSAPSRAWLESMEAEVDNFRAALEWALNERGDVVFGASLAAATIPLFTAVIPGEGEAWIRKALELLPPGSAPSSEARLNLGLVTSSQLTPALEMRAAGERSAALYRSLGDRSRLAEALRGLAQTIGWYFREDRELGDALACESIEIARALGDPIQLAFSLRTRGLTIDISDFPQKRRILEESLALIRAHGNDASIASFLTWISDLEFSAGDESRALEYGREAVLYGESSGSNQHYSETTGNLAAYAAALGDWETAGRAMSESLRVARRARNRMQLTSTIQTAAVIAAGTGKDELAARLYGFCEARYGVIHPRRQADQCEDILHRRLTAALCERIDPARLTELKHHGAAMSEAEAIDLALST